MKGKTEKKDLDHDNTRGNREAATMMPGVATDEYGEIALVLVYPPKQLTRP